MFDLKGCVQSEYYVIPEKKAQAKNLVVAGVCFGHKRCSLESESRINFYGVEICFFYEPENLSSRILFKFSQ